MTVATSVRGLAIKVRIGAYSMHCQRFVQQNKTVFRQAQRAKCLLSAVFALPHIMPASSFHFAQKCGMRIRL